MSIAVVGIGQFNHKNIGEEGNILPVSYTHLDVYKRQHPEWRGKVVLVQVAVPSRGDVEEYQYLRSVVNELSLIHI